jgi:hypothetical protein
LDSEETAPPNSDIAGVVTGRFFKITVFGQLASVGV